VRMRGFENPAYFFALFNQKNFPKAKKLLEGIATFGKFFPLNLHKTKIKTTFKNRLT
jgi:hypothetical protein